MNTNRITHFTTAAFGLAVFSIAGCSEKSHAADAAVPPAATNSATAVPVATTVSAEAASPQWNDFKDYTYDTRASLFSGLKQLEAKVDQQMSKLTAKRAAMNSTVNTKDWDFAMKEMVEARSYLKFTMEELKKSTPETWDQLKEKVGQAWVRSQDAYDKVKSSTTS